ncbi:MAG TPA: class I SAM-dependent methyltransferase [Bacteroidia bacterium]|jgi:trans-aconitate methyltransferase|nr:class I SAM-dependent methyltransferase [Bacteroidia bacterium]
MGNYEKTFETWNKLAHNYQGKFMYFDLYDDTYNLFCEWLEKPNAKIFEIGCGPGNITRYLLNKRPDFKIIATDVAPNMVAVAQENNPAATCMVLDCRELSDMATKFDGVMCGFCMPYLVKDDCLKLIKDSANILNEKGVLYFSAIEDAYSKSTYETSSDGQHTMFVYYHEEIYLQTALKENNFTQVEVKRKHYEKANGTTQTHIIFIARKL